MPSVFCPSCDRTIEYSGESPRFCAYCGKPLVGVDLEATIDFHPSIAEWEFRIDGYRLIRKLGQGGVGTVFEAEELSHDRRVAVKVLSGQLDRGPESLARFRQEGRLASTISHPRCVFVLGADEADGRPYIVMELMTGQTLQSLVEEKGRLPIDLAVAKILDVIEGLMESHRLGVIHRDVKPSNCFLEEDGRVKVGDFGLSKSLRSNASLTRTGTFIGTPLFASPEQIKRDEVDVRTDVYSTAATLYYLLTGHPPFQAEEATAVLAKIVSEAPKPIREEVREIPSGLESAIIRGMERDRARRWPSLREFHEALLPFAPNPIPDAGLAARLGAFILDQVIILVLAAISYLVFFQFLGPLMGGIDLSYPSAFLTYFAITEGIWAGSLGKQLFRLRVFRADRRAEPGLIRALLRAAVLYGVLLGPIELTSLAFQPFLGAVGDVSPALRILFEYVLPSLLGLAIVVGPIRRRNGYRAFHEWMSGTRTVQLPRSRVQSTAHRRRFRPERPGTQKPVGVLDRVGPFKVRGAVRWDLQRKVLTAEDSVLGREVWVELRSQESGPPEDVRRSLSRPTRPRWISGGTSSAGRWDAYTAPSGTPLVDLAGPFGLTWGDARPILSELTDELVAAKLDGTLPDTLSIEQIWVEPDGRIQLVDPLAVSSSTGSPQLGPHADPKEEDREVRGLQLIAKTAAVVLQGGRTILSGPVDQTIRGRVPIHARRLLDRLVGDPSPFRKIHEFQVGLQRTANEPVELGLLPRLLRGSVHLALRLFQLLLALLAALAIISFEVASKISFLNIETAIVLFMLVLSFLFWPVAAAITRSNRLAKLLGGTLVQQDGLRVSRFRCAVREVCFWLPLFAFGLLAVFLLTAVTTNTPEHVRLSIGLLPLVWFALDMAHEITFPGQMFHDRLARTCVVPL